jgi:hypothetical protein
MSKYTNGYIPKINYWSGMVLTATTTEAKERAMAKLTYFINRQLAVYG